MNLGWLPLTVLSGLSGIAFAFISRTALQKGEDSSAFSWWFTTIRSVVFFLISLVLVSTFEWIGSWHLLLLIGVIEAAALYLYMKMHSLVELSLSTVIV